MKFSTPVSSLIFVLLFSFGLAGCSESEPVGRQSLPAAEKEDAASLPPPKKIALVMKTLTNPFFIKMEQGARQAEQELEIEIEIIVKTAAQETSIQQQIGIVEGLIRDKVDAIVIAPGDSIGLIPVLKQAQDAGIIVVNIDNRLDREYSKASGLTNVPFISVDNEQGAYDSAKTLVTQLDRPTEVAILEGIRAAENAKDRKNGAIRAFNESEFVTVVASETAHWKIDEAYEVTKTLLEQHPDIEAIFCANDMMALGAVKYLKDNGHKKVKVAGYDALDQALIAVKNGEMIATVDQQAAEQGYQGVLFAYRALMGERLPAVILIDTRLITKNSSY